MQELPMVSGEHLPREPNAFGLLFPWRGKFEAVPTSSQLIPSVLRYATLNHKTAWTQWATNQVKKSAAVIVTAWVATKSSLTQNANK